MTSRNEAFAKDCPETGRKCFDCNGKWCVRRDIFDTRPAAEPIGEVVGHSAPGEPIVRWLDEGLRPIGMKLYGAPVSETARSSDQLQAGVEAYLTWRENKEMHGGNLHALASRMFAAMTDAAPQERQPADPGRVNSVRSPQAENTPAALLPTHEPQSLADKPRDDKVREVPTPRMDALKRYMPCQDYPMDGGFDVVPYEDAAKLERELAEADEWAQKWKGMAMEGGITRSAELPNPLLSHECGAHMACRICGSLPIAQSHEPSISLDTLDWERLRSGQYRALNPDNQPLFDQFFARSAIATTDAAPQASPSVAPADSGLVLAAGPAAAAPVYLLNGVPHRLCDCPKWEGKCPRGVERKLLTAQLSQCLIPAPDVLIAGPGRFVVSLAGIHECDCNTSPHLKTCATRKNRADSGAKP